MPTYEFECPAGHRSEKFFRTFADAPTERPCPECGAIAARRISGGAGLVFKGSGFYVTDYGKGGKKPESGTAESAPAASEAKGDAKGPSAPAGADGKSASTAETKPGKKSTTNE